MSLQIRVSEVVGEGLAVPLTQRNTFRHFSRLLNSRSLAQKSYDRTCQTPSKSAHNYPKLRNHRIIDLSL